MGTGRSPSGCPRGSRKGWALVSLYRSDMGRLATTSRWLQEAVWGYLGHAPASDSVVESPADHPMHVILSDVTMRFGRRAVFERLSCGFPRGKISVILGGSGVGKSTILRLIGGLIRPQSGKVIVDGRDVTRLSEWGITDVRRKLGMVFQGGALLDSYNVYENLALPLREHTKMSEAEIVKAVKESLVSVGVDDALELLPGELSGGMLRRVALARAILRKPVILMCDEPFSGLDPVSIKRIEKLLRSINKQYGITLIVVSHDVPSTMRMADHVLLMLGDRAVEGSPVELRDSRDGEASEFMNEGLDQGVSPGA